MTLIFLKTSLISHMAIYIHWWVFVLYLEKYMANTGKHGDTGKYRLHMKTNTQIIYIKANF